MKFIKSSQSFSMTEEEFWDLNNLYIGLCVKCGEERDCCEPDAREYDCESCGENGVYGVQELLVMGKVDII